MDKDIVERLRAMSPRFALTGDMDSEAPLINPDGPEAATEIERLQDEVERLTKSHALILDSNNNWAAQAEAAERLNGELRIALAQAGVPLEGLLLCRANGILDLSENSWAEIENGVKHIRAVLDSKEKG